MDSKRKDNDFLRDRGKCNYYRVIITARNAGEIFK